MLGHPYKFLDVFTEHDAGVFAGRRKEADILLNDILASKLVVLSGPTGSGKSSLINAGVRPHLTRLDYKNVVVRVEQDLVQSTMLALIEARLLREQLPDTHFAALAQEAVRLADAPVVIVLDQFEEFFTDVPVMAQQAFIEDLANVSSDASTDVHILLSMREDSFSELDRFREQIPRIYQQDSLLRLRFLDATGAREAIEAPAAKFGVTFEPALVTAIVEELATDEYVEPARLQIVCDTLWTTLSGSSTTVTLNQFQSLGGAQGILRSRLPDDLNASLSETALRALEPTIDDLSNDQGEKTLCPVHELKARASFTPEAIEELVRALVDLRFLRESVRMGVRCIEWSSYYFAKHSHQLREAVHQLWQDRLKFRLTYSSPTPGDLREISAAQLPELSAKTALRLVVESTLRDGLNVKQRLGDDD